MKKKKVRMGVVKVSLEYAVDLNDSEMVENAKDAVFEDLCSMAKGDEYDSYIKVEKTKKYKHSDIPEFLIEYSERDCQDCDGGKCDDCIQI